MATLVALADGQGNKNSNDGDMSMGFVNTLSMLYSRSIFVQKNALFPRSQFSTKRHYYLQEREDCLGGLP